MSDDENYRARWLEANKERRVLRRKLARAERKLDRTMDRLDCREKRIEEVEKELRIAKGELVLRREIAGLNDQIDRMRRKRGMPLDERG